MKYNIIIAVLLLLLGIAGTGLGTTNQVLAWNGDDWYHGCCGPHWGVGDYQPSYFYQQPGFGGYQNGWYAGQQDAIYDHDNNLQYNPVGQCLSCHSEIYWKGFHEGYDKQWNSYQSTNQGTSINIYGNGNYVNTDQNSVQSSGPFPIGQGPGLCGSFDCGGPGGGGPDP